MEIREILAELDHEIAKLQQARAILSETTDTKKVAVKASAEKPTAKKRSLTPEGRKRIAEAMKRRWAERRKQAAKSGK